MYKLVRNNNNTNNNTNTKQAYPAGPGYESPVYYDDSYDNNGYSNGGYGNGGYGNNGGGGPGALETVGEKAGDVKRACCNDDVKEQLKTLTMYTATILMALAWWDFISEGIFHSIDKDWGSTLWLLWLGAVICIIFAMAVTFYTGETLKFGEDCC